MKFICPACFGNPLGMGHCSLCGNGVVPARQVPEPDMVDLARVDESVMDGRWQRDMLAALRHGISLIRRGDVGGGVGVLSGVENLLLHAVPPGLDIVGELPSRVADENDVIDLDREEGQPSADGSCSCGAMVLSTGSDPCPFCGGYTAAQLGIDARKAE